MTNVNGKNSCLTVVANLYVLLAAIQCDPLVLPADIKVHPSFCTGSSEVDIGTTCSLYCDPGLTFIGEDTPIECEDDGQWTRIVNSSTHVRCEGTIKAKAQGWKS